MIRSGEEILADIDATLDQLIHNAETVRCVSPHSLLNDEMDAMQKTQESLLARLIHMNDLLDGDRKKRVRKKTETLATIENKIEAFGKLNAEILARVSHGFKPPASSKHKVRQKLKVS